MSSPKTVMSKSDALDAEVLPSRRTPRTGARGAALFVMMFYILLAFDWESKVHL
jgi:hypothetical protein